MIRLVALAILTAACGRLEFTEHDASAQATDAPLADDMSVACPVGYQKIDVTKRRYRVVSAPALWADAAATCSADGTHLFVPDDAEEMATVIAFAGPLPNPGTLLDGDLWIGVTDLATEGVYVTEAGDPAPYLPWAATQPDDFGGDEDCEQYNPAGELNDLNCDGFQLPSVCECP